MMKGLKRMLTGLVVTAVLFAFTAVQAEDAQPAPAGRDAFRTVGNTVVFGRYEQDNDPTDGMEGIEWIVLDVDGEKALLLSKYGLETVQYSSTYEATTWETCTVRQWLNHEFMDTAFTEEEKAAILVTDVDNSPGQGYSEWHAPGGNNTQDQVFLLSYAEANKYLNVTYENRENIEARVIPTAYALAKGALTSEGFLTTEGTDAGRWWLRSPGHVPVRAAYVYRTGSLSDAHVTAFNYRFGGRAVARPAFWLDLTADIF